MLYPIQRRSPVQPHRSAGAITSARRLLRKLTNPQETPRVPLFVRSEARALLRYFPAEHQLETMLRDQLLVRELPKVKTFPIWPEHEFL